MGDYTATHYAATRSDDRRWPRAAGRIEVETCVIGGGLAGVATALELAERGRSVCLVESHRIGWGASGRNGGFASRGYPVGILDLAARYGRDRALALWQLSGAALAKVGERAGRLGPDIIQGRGALRCRMAEHPDTLPGLVETLNRDYDAGLVMLPQAELRDMLVSDRYADGYLNPSTLQLQPLNLARAMAGEAARLGARLHENSAVVELDLGGAGRRIRTDAADIHARHVVLAGGAYMGLLHPRLGLATVPVATFVMTTPPMADRLSQVIRTTAAVSDTRVATDYYRRLPDGRLLWGGRASACEPGPERLAALLRRDVAGIYPQLGDIEIETAWGGVMPYARHRMPIIGPLGPGVWAAACFGGLGLTSTTLAGDLIAAAIADGDDRHHHFAPFAPVFAGGSLGRIAFQAIYWRHQLEDRISRFRHEAAA
ncbi:MAG: FAD-binding oxidoreductase [Alphaproteobacteria bacterium]|jgi:gamma-glutamylputrescine oxidase|nr:FAD-binding oxidoreductase [Alphaproteobacteria bacterium]